MAAKKTATKTKAAASAAQSKPPTKTEILTHIASETGLSKKDVGAVMDSLQGLIQKNVKPRGAGMFTLPGLLKIKVVKKPATKARMGRDPRTGGEMMIKAKPARKAVKVLPLKSLKEMI
jgi:nucleoid DNA-binding protein